MKKIVSFSIIMCLVLAGCSKTPHSKITFATLPAEPSLPVIVAHEMGYFNDLALDVELVPFANPQERNAAAQTGNINGMIADIMTALSMNDVDNAWILGSNINEDFKVLSSPQSSIRTINQLNDATVALIPGLVLEYIMDTLVSQHNTSYTVLAMPSFQARFEGLLQNQFDAVIFTEPQASMLIDNGAHLLASSNDEGINAGAMLFNKSIDQTTLHNFYQAIDKATDFLNNTQDYDYSDILKKYQFPPQMNAYIQAKRGLFKHPKAVDETTVETVIKWSTEKKLIKKPVDQSGLIMKHQS